MASELFESDLSEEDEQPPELFQKSDLTDITLVVEGKELHFVKFLLIQGSTVFDQMIKSSADPSRLKLDDLLYKDMVMFLECLHPKCFLEINDKNLEPVATIGRKFEYERILQICEQYIIQKFKKVRTTKDRMYPQFFFHLRVADKCGLEEAIETGVSSKQAELAYFSNAKWGRKGYEYNVNFSQISLETKFRMISNRLKEAEKRIPRDNLY
ncbi:hypothetical protein CHS0354_016721 [Potamilus streckersoni]|uniref:BTB domain-containing protein n=1 Tax=Potamilus streckersoni TaxID=2493646 RepID=A0AAE0WBP8_9BIVA|nr:hypothetical protein CHS0354_016721 [Potamilus streckersoni]